MNELATKIIIDKIPTRVKRIVTVYNVNAPVTLITEHFLIHPTLDMNLKNLYYVYDIDNNHTIHLELDNIMIEGFLSEFVEDIV